MIVDKCKINVCLPARIIKQCPTSKKVGHYVLQLKYNHFWLYKQKMITVKIKKRAIWHAFYYIPSAKQTP